MEESNSPVKCSKCDELGRVFCTRFEEAEGTSTQIAYCHNHASEDAMVAAYAPGSSVFTEVTGEQLDEVLRIIREFKAIPTSAKLPSGAWNPFCGRLDVNGYHVEEIQSLIDKIDGML